jgi:cytochrome c oxidase subunit 2
MEAMNMKKFKGVLFLVLIVSLFIVLSACGGGNDEAAEPAPTNENTSPGNGAAGGEGQEIAINATNWAFEPNEITVKRGTTVTLTLNNAEGFHGIAIPDYDLSIQAGKPVTFVADKTGEFEFACSIQCGAGHADMKGKLIVTE